MSLNRLSSHLLREAAGKPAYRTLPCAFCRPNNLNVTLTPRKTASSAFHSNANLWARKGRGTTSSINIGQGERVDPRADELADEILDELFGEGYKKGKKEVTHEQVRSEASERAVDKTMGDQSAKAGKGEAARDVWSTSVPSQFAVEEDRIAVEKLSGGADALPRDQYADYGIESVEDRERRRDIEKTYYDVRATEQSSQSTSDDWYLDQAYNLEEEAPQQSAFVPRWMRGIAVAERRSQGLEPEDITEDRTGPLRLTEIVSVLREEKGSNLVVIDMRDKCDYTDYMVIVEGRSKKHIYALADSVRRRAKHRIPYDPSLPNTLTIEGADSEDWMVLDTGRFIIHCFTPEARARYNLEGLWTAIKDPLLALARNANVDVQQQLTEAERGWDSRPREEFRIKQIERKHMLAEEEVVDRFNAANS